jgi:CubicO group peptidase (beta-lactamase class C family)
MMRPALIDDYIARQIQADGPGLALAIVADGAVVHSATFGLANLRKGPVKLDTIFHLASCGKQFTALGILMLAEEGKLDLDDPVGKHIPSIAGFGPGVTLRKLLHHTSGICDLYDENGVKRLLERCARPANDDVIRTYADLGCPMAELEIAADGIFSYSNSGYELLGAVIEEVSGQPYHDFFAKRVFEPLKMKDTFSVPDRRIHDPRCATGYLLGERGELIEARASELDGLMGSGSFYTTVSDLCLYDRALRSNLLISEASKKKAFTAAPTNEGSGIGYGFGWYLGTRAGISFADHEGTWNGFQSYICYYIDRPLSIFMLSNDPEVDLLEIADTAMDACR